MDKTSILHNIKTAFSAQGISLVASSAMSLLVPKVLGVEGFGYWQLFIFYASYTGFFHLGLNDGVYLLNGGKQRFQLHLRSLNSQFLLGMSIQLLMALAIAAFVFASERGSSRTFILAATAVNLVLTNASGFLGYLFQAVNETRLFSLSTVADRAPFLVVLVLMVLLGVDDFRCYVALYLLTKGLSFAFCLWNARDMLFSGFSGLGEAWRDTVRSVRVGIKLMLANIASMLVLGVARALVDAVWGIEEFGRVSLSLSLVNFFITFVTQVSMVLFPALRRSGRSELASLFRRIRDALGLVLPLAYILYFPMAWILSAWLPQYSESMRYLALLMPLCLFNARMDLCGSTFLKVLREERVLLLLNAATVIVSTVTVCIGVYVFESLDAVLVGVSFSVAIRAIAAEAWVASELEERVNLTVFSETALSAAFVCAATCVGGIPAVLLVMAVYGFFLFVHRDKLRPLIMAARH